jgi:hypothetical protein
MASQTPDWTWELKNNDTQSQDADNIKTVNVDVLPTIALDQTTHTSKFSHPIDK